MPEPTYPPEPQIIMPQGDKSSYTSKQKRQAAHIEESYEKRGVSEKTAEARAWATVNQQTGGGKKQGGAGKRGGAKKRTTKRTTAKRTTKRASSRKRSPGRKRK